MNNKEEYVLQFVGPYDNDFFEVDGTDGSIRTSSYMTDIRHYGSLKLAELAVAAFRSRNRNAKIQIIKIQQEVVKVDDCGVSAESDGAGKGDLDLLFRGGK